MSREKRPSKDAPNLTFALERIPSGTVLPPNALRTAVRLVIDATDHRDSDIAALADEFVYTQLKYPYIKPVFLISALDPKELKRAGFLYETVVPETMWDEAALGGSYHDYKERRFHEMITTYEPDRMGKLRPGQRIPRWMYER